MTFSPKRTLVFISISVCSSHRIVRLYLLPKLSLAIFSPKISYPGSTHLHKAGGEKLWLKHETENMLASLRADTSKALCGTKYKAVSCESGY